MSGTFLLARELVTVSSLAAVELVRCEDGGYRHQLYYVLSNHWHLVVRPKADGEMSRFAQWLTLTHTQRYHIHHHSAGEGHLYQGRFKSFPVQDDDHFLTVNRYVERNAYSANLCSSPELWRFGSPRPRGRPKKLSVSSAGADL